MFRKIFPIILCICLLCLFSFWVQFRDETHKELTTFNEELLQAVEQRNKNASLNALTNMENAFKNRQDVFKSLAVHRFGDEIFEHINAIKVGLELGDDLQVKTEIALLQAHLDGYVKDDKITFENIF